MAFASSFDQIGPFSKTTLGLAKCLEVISGYDSKDSTSSKEKVPEYSKNIETILPEGETEETTTHDTLGAEKISFEKVFNKSIYLLTN